MGFHREFPMGFHRECGMWRRVPMGFHSRAGVLLANFRAREADFALTFKGWPWKGGAVCTRYLLD